MHVYEVLRRPVITEKATLQANYQGRYTFEVDMRANKIQIKEAVEKAFDVHVVSVNVARMPGKRRRFGRREGSVPPWKKAVVTLAEGESIELFEGV